MTEPPPEIVVDTSAAVAILTGRAGSDELVQLLADAQDRWMSAANAVELTIVVEARWGTAATGLAQRFLTDAAIDVIPVDQQQTDLAVAAWRRYGKGRHPAALNLGDCFAYALAVARAVPLLCVGDDVAATDVELLPQRDGATRA